MGFIELHIAQVVMSVDGKYTEYIPVMLNVDHIAQYMGSGDHTSIQTDNDWVTAKEGYEEVKRKIHRALYGAYPGEYDKPNEALADLYHRVVQSIDECKNIKKYATVPMTEDEIKEFEQETGMKCAGYREVHGGGGSYGVMGDKK